MSLTALCLLIFASVYTYSKEKNMSTTTSLWALIDKIGTAQPVKKEQFDSLLAATLTETSKNEYFTFWSGTSALQLEGKAKITKIELGIANKEPANAMMTLSIGDGCVSKRDVTAYFPMMKIHGAPTGRSLDEETTYVAEEKWGEVTLGFAERNSDCLSSVGFEFKKK